MSCYCKCPVLFLAVPWVGLQFVIVVFPDYNHLRFSGKYLSQNREFISHILLRLYNEILLIVFFFVSFTKSLEKRVYTLAK